MPSRLILCALLSAGLWACAQDDAPPGPCTPGENTSWGGETVTPFDVVSKYCMVKLEGGTIVPLAGVTPYDLNTPLFSDRAVKVRTVFVPKGASPAAYDAVKALDFPPGTIVTKSFGMRDDLRKPAPLVTWIETRVMLRAQDGWHGYAYEWNAAQTEATLLAGGGVRTLSWLDENGATETASYLIPAATQCRGCHELKPGASADAAVTLIGPTARNLNRDFAYAGGAQNQLEHWTAAGLLSGAPDAAQAPKLPVWNDPATGTVEQRARAYLEVNCGHCHNEGGPARTSGLFLMTFITEPVKYGVCKGPVAAGPGAGGLKYDVLPGDPDHSIVAYRMASTTPGVLMPQIGRSVVDKQGLELVRAWITGHAGTCP